MIKKCDCCSAVFSVSPSVRVCKKDNCAGRLLVHEPIVRSRVIATFHDNDKATLGELTDYGFLLISDMMAVAMLTEANTILDTRIQETFGKIVEGTHEEIYEMIHS